MSACVGDDQGGDRPQDLQLTASGGPVARVVINNPYNFTVGVVVFQDCNQNSFAKPQPQTIEPQASATYEVAPGCYVVSAGEAGLSFNHAVESRQINIGAGQEIKLP
ncbi:MAG: hypothetical protein H6888_09325 [Nitratireductor sp.]|nr:hypothetical protein [Nitratireductor sp.]